jgi:hypothetical protein
MVGAIYVGNNVDSGNAFESQTMSNILALSSIWAMSSAMSAHTQSKTIGENFLVQMAPALNRQVTVQVEWMESRQEITARDFAEFRSKVLALYQSSVRMIASTTDSDCVFRHPSLDQPGRWFGRCVDGLAEGSGYGLVIDDQGRALEFVGSGRSGLAEGVGAMVFRSPAQTGAVYFEGSFRQGLPDGVVRVEEPGRKSRVRLFRDGRDSGAASADELQRIQF